jgi:polyhydroxybutyrate depolymerase
MKIQSAMWGLGVGALFTLACSSQPVIPTGAVQTTGSGGGTGTSLGAGSGTGGSPTSGSSVSGAATTSGTNVGSGTVAMTSGTPGSGTAEGSGSSGSTIQDAGAGTPEGGTIAMGGGANDAAMMYDANMTVPTTGCGKPPGQVVAKYIQYNIMVTTGLAAAYVKQYTARNFYVRLPTGYDPMRAYTTIFLGTGCGGNGMTVLPMENASTTNAILVGLSPIGQCFMTSAADSPEIPFFDAALSQVESSFCVDKAHVFIAGFSSGSWLSNLIGCARAGIVRGQGNATGGLPPIPMCSGPIAAMLAHDENDPANGIAGGEAARDRILKENGCSLTDTEPYDAGNGKPSMCVKYQNCPAAYPVVWCPTTGQGHSDQVGTGLSVPGFWNFWEALPYVPPSQ